MRIDIYRNNIYAFHRTALRGQTEINGETYGNHFVFSGPYSVDSVLEGVKALLEWETEIRKYLESTNDN